MTSPRRSGQLGEGAVHPYDRRNRAWYVDALMRSVVLVGGISTIVFLLAILVFIATEGLEFALHRLDWVQLFTSGAWRPTSKSPTYGALYLIAGTAAVTVVAMAVSVPFSLAAAVYIGELAPARRREWLKILIELLAAVPSVVWGFVGARLLGPLLVDVFGADTGPNLLNAGIILGLMAAPIITTIAEDALRAVPDSFREAAEALGATRWQVVLRVVLPHSRPGLSAAILLGIGRAFGETMAVLMASGHAVKWPDSLFSPVSTITATIASELGETANGSDHYQALFVLGVLLFAVTFVFNLAADLLVRGRRPR
jgi:phosphate transport system permease protein